MAGESLFMTELMCGDALDLVTDTEGKRSFALRLLAASLVHQDGSRRFSSVDEAAANIPFSDYLRLHPIAQRLNGLTEGVAGEA